MKKIISIGSVLVLTFGILASGVSQAFATTAPDGAVLGVTQISAIQTYATADGQYADGWQWVFDVTVPNNEPIVSMKFADWTNGSNIIPAADNIQFYSAQSTNASSSASAISITASGTYSGAMDLNTGTDLNINQAGRQIQITVEARVPADSAGGSYSTSYGIKSLPDTTPPVITLLGTSPVTVTQSSTYVDAGATAFDEVDGDITSKIAVTGTVDTSVVGTSTLTYNVTDSDGLAAVPVIRTVDVVPAYTLTYAAGANGTITGSSTQAVGFGGSGTAVTAVPDTGYSFASWSDGSTANPRTDTDVTADVSVTANFATTTYTITASTVGASVFGPKHGTISPSGTSTVDSGGSETYTITPDTGYQVLDLVVDGVSTTTADSYNFSDVTADHAIMVSFSPVENPSLAELTIASSAIGTQLNASTTNDLVGAWIFSAYNSPVLLDSIRFSVVGSASSSDLQNVRLMVDGAQVGPTLSSVAQDDTAFFDVLGTPATLATGANNIQVRADVAGSPGENFQFEIASGTDVSVTDSHYDVPIQTNANAGTEVDIVSPLLTADLILTIPASTTIAQSALVPETSGMPTNGSTSVTDAVVGLTPILVNLKNTGAAASADNVRISPIGASSTIQLWAQDSSGNWFDINVTGWGPSGGFPVPVGYSASTGVYVISDATGTYPLMVNLIDASSSAVITSATGTVMVNPPLKTYTIISVASLNNITIGEGIVSPNLPSIIGVTLSDESTSTLPIVWSTASAPTYNDEATGTYTFTGTLTLPGDGSITNPSSLTATGNVVVVAVGPTPGLSHITSVNPISDITIGEGIVSPNLPSTAGVALSNGSTPSYAVTWNNGSPTYNDEATGTYTFTGTLTTPLGVSANGKTASVNVIVTAANVTTNPATDVTSADATLNGLNGPADASGHSFWVSTSTFSTASPTIPTGVYSTPDLGAIAASTTFSATLSSITIAGLPANLPAVTASTTYYFAAWSNVGGIWYPGAILNFTTIPLSSDDTLSALTVSAGTLSPAFASGTTSYADVLPYGTTAIPTVTATLDNPNATDTITQATSTTGSAMVKVTAQDGTTTQTYTVNFSVASATVLAVAAVYPVPTVSVVDGTTLVNIGLPTSVPVALSNGMTKILPITWDGSLYNPTTPGTYTFTGTLTLPTGIINPNGKTATVKVVVAPVQSSAKNIISFGFGLTDETDVIGSGTVAVTVPSSTVVTSLTPTIAVSANATVSPNSGVLENFTSPVTYTVTAQDGTTQAYAVTVTAGQ